MSEMKEALGTRLRNDELSIYLPYENRLSLRKPTIFTPQIDANSEIYHRSRDDVMKIQKWNVISHNQLSIVDKINCKVPLCSYT